MLTIVIGDIHGMAAKLENLLGQIDMWCAANARAELRQLIFLGDYIDRGPDSRQILQIVQRLQAEGAICLRGNHEELMLQATESEGDLTNFLANGGDATITSLRTPAAFRRAQEWIRALRTSHEDEVRYYVHAGIRPGIPLDQQTAETKLWIRDRFLRHRGPFPKYIVHGHTPTIYLDPQQTMPNVRDNRCNVDTGAGMNGPLSAAIYNDRQTKPIHTISVGAEVIGRCICVVRKGRFRRDTVDLYAGIRRAVIVDGLSRREAAKRFGVHGNTITKMLQFSVPPGYRRRERPASKKLGPYMAWIDKVLEDDRSVTRSTHTAHRIFERLRCSARTPTAFRPQPSRGSRTLGPANYRLSHLAQTAVWLRLMLQWIASFGNLASPRAAICSLSRHPPTALRGFGIEPVDGAGGLDEVRAIPFDAAKIVRPHHMVSGPERLLPVFRFHTNLPAM